MRRSVRNILVAATTTVMTTAALPAFPAMGAEGSVTVEFATTSTWSTGYAVLATITNATAAPVGSWTIAFDLPAGSTITSIWSADRTGSDHHHVVTARSGDRAIAAGKTRSWGYVSTGSFVTPQHCTINGSPCGGAPEPATPTPETPTPETPGPMPPPPETPAPAAKKIVGYYTAWAMYSANVHVKDVETSGQAARLTHLIYGFGNTTNGQCVTGDAYADFGRAYSAAMSVDGIADTQSSPVRGNFGQLLRLKRMHPNLKILYSFGGWGWSAGFTQAAANPGAFAESCYNLVNDPRWLGLFDGIDIDWEYPNACGMQCDTSGFGSFNTLMTAVRQRFGPSALVTAAITPNGASGGMMDLADYAGAAQQADWLMPMTYGYAGAWRPTGPIGLHAALTTYPGIRDDNLTSATAIAKLIALGVPSSKILLGFDSYGRGWSGVTQDAPGGSATGVAPGTHSPGVSPYRRLKTACPTTGSAGGSAYARCGDQWWSYDTPATVATKMTYVQEQRLGGAFLWELAGDTASGELVTAMHTGLS